MARSRYKILDEGYPHFITITVVGFKSIFYDPNLASIILDGLHFLTEKRKITIYAFVIMPNHIHAIIEGESLAKKIASFKSYTARKIIDYLRQENQESLLTHLRKHKLQFKTDREFQLWQEGFHPKIIQNELVMTQKMEYIHYNPVKAGLVEHDWQWELSSARFYLDGSSVLTITHFSG